jgi:hypothetical protein
LPSIRQYGNYSIEDQNKKQFEKLNNKLKALRKESEKKIEDIGHKLKACRKEKKVLKHNQKKIKYKRGGMIYILRDINTTKPKLLKPGKSGDFNARLNTYNTSFPDNMQILFSMEVASPDAVEYCVKAFMLPYVYRGIKEYYECTIKFLRETMIRCDKLVKGDFYCDQCQSRIESFDGVDGFDKFFDHATVTHGIDVDDKLFLNISKDQNGGANNKIDNYSDNEIECYSDDEIGCYVYEEIDCYSNDEISSHVHEEIDYRKKYLKYKYKYLSLKNNFR